MLKLYFSGADGVVAVPETLTSGMVGKEICFSFSDEWNGLSKVAVFSAGRVVRDVVLKENVILIPPEVLQIPMRHLYVGVYGVSSDGSLVIPTVRVKGPFIEAGTDPSGDASLEPTLAVWSQALASIGNLSELQTEAKDTLVAAVNELTAQLEVLGSIGDLNALDTQAKDTLVAAVNEVAAQLETLGSIGDLNALDTQAKDTLVAAINEVAAGTESGLTGTEKQLLLSLLKKAAYISDVSQSMEQLDALWGSEAGEEDAQEHVHAYSIAVTKAATCTEDGTRACSCACGHGYTEVIPATGHSYESAVTAPTCTAQGYTTHTCKNCGNVFLDTYTEALGHSYENGVCSRCGETDPNYAQEVTLTGISASYSGADVTVGTALSSLSGIVVTAHYSDGSSEAVSEYTLEGEILEGSNTITVTYEGLQTTFNVTGVAEEETPVTYSITNTLTNVTSSNAETSAEGNTAYYAQLNASDGYQLSTVTVQMGGQDVTAAVYDGTAVNISAVTGDIVITAVAIPEKGELVYNWDLTSGLTDTVGGLTATLGGGAVQDEHGLTISDATGSCYFGSDVFSAGRTVEIDVASADFRNAGTNGFFVMINTDGVNGVGKAGLTYRSTGQWQNYYFGWGTPKAVVTDGNAIGGRTVRFCSTGAYNYEVYIGDTLLASVDTSALGKHYTALQIGSKTTAYFALVITAVRVYGEVA